MLEGDTQLAAQDLFRLGAGLCQRGRQAIGLLARVAPERQLTDMAQQRGDKHLLLLPLVQILGQVAGLHRTMKRARQQRLQLLTRRLRQQTIKQADRQPDHAHLIKAHHHNRSRQGLDDLATRVAVDTVADAQHLGCQCGIAHQHIGQLPDRRGF